MAAVMEESVVDGGGEESLSDTLGDAYDKAFAGVTEDAPEPAEPKKRDESGKFASAKPAATKPEKEAPVAAAGETKPVIESPAAAEPVSAPTPTTTGPDLSKAPSTWKADAAAGWESIPEAQRAEIYRREADSASGLERDRDIVHFGRDFAKALSPMADYIRDTGETPAKVAADWVGFGANLRNADADGRRAIIQSLAQACGVQFGGEQTQAEQTPVDPRFAALQQQMARLEQFTQAQIAEQNAAHTREAQEQIEAFKADPKNEHFKEVEREMKRLLLANVANGLQDAYDQACWTNPVVRAKLFAKQQADLAAEAAKKAAEAKAAAAVNLPRRGALQSATPIGKMEDTIAAAWDRSMRG